MNKPEYIVDLCNGLWCVFKMEYIGSSSYGNKISSYHTRKEAQNEADRLNKISEL
ncbi:hypothetical protein [Paludibacter sp. 221]|uniref:hypothetical protein n=1 Tax=Paludibacter sp. 221 TaxID=2302939 RepID=UPI0013D6E00F|nr:hypothetical protein [Paludibacter sp. 221]